jgi:Na+/proline symporter
MNPVLIGVLVYVVAQLAIVLFIARRMRGENDYLLAGRRLGPGLATFTVFATWFGAETCIGAAGAVYGGGLAASTADPFGYSLCLVLMGFLFAAPLWRRKLTTFADLFRQRFSPGVERFAALLLVPTSILWAAAQIRAMGQVISATSSFDVELAIAVAAAVVVVYTVAGGMLADAYADLVQGIVVMIGLILVLVGAVQAVGGFGAALEVIKPEQLQLFGTSETPWLAVLERWAVPVLGSMLAQELVAVMLASRSPQVAQRAALTGGGLYLTFGLIPVFIGLIGPHLLPGLQEPEQLLPQVARQHLSTFLYIVFVGAMVSAILSTVAGALLAAAAIASHNLAVPLKPTILPHTKVRVARIAVVLGGAGAYFLARHADSVYALVEEASAFGSSGIVTAALFGLFTRFGGPRAAFAALGTGVATWSAGSYWLNFPYPYLASVAAALAAYLLLALTEPHAKASFTK